MLYIAALVAPSGATIFLVSLLVGVKFSCLRGYSNLLNFSAAIDAGKRRCGGVAFLPSKSQSKLTTTQNSVYLQLTAERRGMLVAQASRQPTTKLAEQANFLIISRKWQCTKYPSKACDGQQHPQSISVCTVINIFLTYCWLMSVVDLEHRMNCKTLHPVLPGAMFLFSGWAYA